MNHTDIAKQLNTLRDFLRFGASQFNRQALFFGHGTASAIDDAQALIAHALHLPPVLDASILDARLLDEEKRDILALFEKRMTQRVPVPYLTQRAYFCELPFYVDERVLIPRSPIAELIQSRFKPFYLGAPPEAILDLCTGGGCIGIATAYAFEDAEVVLSDISEDALTVATKNIVMHGLEDRVRICQSDLFQNVAGKYDIIVTNPPYVDAEDLADMPEEFGHEPVQALASGTLGLDHPLQIFLQAADHLTGTGLLIMEVGNSAGHLASMFPDIDFNWVNLEQGGQGVLVMSHLELEEFTPLLKARMAV